MIAYAPELVLKWNQLKSYTAQIEKQPQPLDELVNFIIENNGLPVAKAREQFGWSGEKCKEIGNKLEQWGILQR